MGQTTKIEWADATFSPWEGCTQIGPGCDHCYALDMNARWRGGVNWGAGAPRRTTDWDAAFRLERKAQREGRQLRVFPSICDPFDGEVADGLRADYFALIRATPHLTHLLLTKRPASASRWFYMCPSDAALPNIQVGVTVCNQDEADRFRETFTAIPVAVKFVSYEPALGPIDWGGWEFVQQIIYGGESGNRARPANVGWARATVAWCKANRVAAFVKQLGAIAVAVCTKCNGAGTDASFIPGKEWGQETYCPRCLGAHTQSVPIHDSKGGDMAEWPEDLRVRQFPEVTRG